MSEFHRLPPTILHSMSAGGDRAEREVLHAGQVSRRLAQLRAILDVVAERWPEAGRTAGIHDSFDALAAVQRQAPGTVRELLSGPQVGAWAASCLRRLGHGATGTPPLWVFLGHLGSIAAAAASLSGTQVRVRVPAHAGIVGIPSVGRATMPSDEEWALIECTAGPDIVLLDGKAPTERLPVRTLRTEAGGVALDIQIDELDPYWRSFGIPIRNRLTDEEVDRWGECVAESWRILAARHEHRLLTLAAAIRCLVPVEQGGRLGRVSASSADAPGAIALTEPTNPTRLAATLIHESQHYRLSALHDLRPLYREPARNVLYSPWRNDPRPLSGVVHGAQAFLGVADFWLRERSNPVAELEYARHVSQLGVAMNVLTRADDLTSFGRALARSLTKAIDNLPSEAGTPAVRRIADDLVAEHEASWRLRNVTPSESDVRALAAAWQRGESPTVTEIDHPGEVMPAEPSGDNPLTRLATAWVENAEEVRALATDPATFTTRFPGAIPTDVPLLDGDYTTTKNTALTRIDTGTANHRDWSALAVAHGRLCPQPSSSPLASRPELAKAAWQLAAAKVTSLDAVLSRYEAGTSMSDSMRR